jgi:predicted nuclease of predicted toxin-antitoxin system
LLPALLADVNVATPVVAFLRASGADIVTVAEIGAAAWTDDEILAASVARRRFVLTHDVDFGRLAMAEGRPYYGILLLRPGDQPPAVVIESLRPLLAADCAWRPPVIVVHAAGRLRVRRSPDA